MDTIRKDIAALRVQPNLVDLDAERARFRGTRRRLDGLPNGRGLNIAHEAVDRHANGPRAGHVALRWLGVEGHTREFTYAGLREATSRFANALAALGVRAGEHVFVLAGRIPQLYFAVLGALKHHLFDVGRRFYGGNAIVGGALPVAVGFALADVMRKSNRVTACFFGKGAVAEGEFHESANLAALWNLPVLYPPQVALVALGRVSPRPLVREGAIVAAGALNVTLSADHRVTDGMAGARLLARLRERLQHRESP
ncbi:MAG TPA: thiamine pyrophosphate-dependent enzyme [Burkholderiaceae bacterium]|nr:thiamine pyrophosphate-dependent enzyme [Burkholderiaceae bacterium]